MESITVDLITFDKAHDEFVIYLIEDGPWPECNDDWNSCLQGIQNRIFAAIDLAIDGHLVSKFPESLGAKIRIELDSPHGCPQPVEELFDAIMNFTGSDDSYRTAIQTSKYISHLRLVTGKQMGRFKTDHEPRTESA